MGNEASVKDDLAGYLAEIEHQEQRKDYDGRNTFVYHALSAAASLGYSCGVRLDPSEPEWPVAYIELPTGQVSWHLPQHEREWDGHDTPEKYRRCREFAG